MIIWGKKGDEGRGEKKIIGIDGRMTEVLSRLR